MLTDITYKCPKCDFNFSLLFDPALETKEDLEDIETCPCCGGKMSHVRERVWEDDTGEDLD